MAVSDKKEGQSKDEHVLKAPSISLPNGGGAIRGMGEKFTANPVTGTGSMSVPIATSPGRGGFGTQISLSYDSGAGNGPFGLGWSLSLPSITRKTDKGLPRYLEDSESDVFILSGAEDLVPVIKKDTQGKWIYEKDERIVNGTKYRIRRYRPRVEGLFARIERWTNASKPEDVFWRSISKDNITTWYAKSEDSRIADPEHPERIFSWLICQSYDDKGNVIKYQYKAENADSVDLSKAHENNRGDEDDKRRTSNKYLKRIFYGNHKPYLPKLQENEPWPEPPDEWNFEVVFDYGEHNEAKPAPEETGKWNLRNDPFSSYRSTFEIRTYRLCQRVLMFHHIPDDDPHDPDGQKGYDGLVRSTDFTYEYENDAANSRTPIYSKLVEVTQRSYKLTDDGNYLTAQLPPLEFSYRDAEIQTELKELQGDSLENMPIGIEGANYQWIDLDGEGLSGLLTEQANAWYYKRNLSPISLADGPIEAKFGPTELVLTKPAVALADHAQFLDLAGDGRPDVVQFAGPAPGFYERTMDGQWYPFVPFASLPNVNWNDPNLKFIDLDGNGHADILISEHDAFVWYPSLGEAGFDAAQRVSKSWDEENGPHIVFADGEQSIYLSDMSGDGLSDIVRIRNSEVCYWPNLGYGRFGSKVTMERAPDHDPLFDDQDYFDPRRIRLADIDGTGTTDIIYLHREGVRVYFNQSGNSWSAPTMIHSFPVPDNTTSVQAMDFLGNGTAYLVWSSPLPSDACRPLRYLDLMGGQKPHLLEKTVNNLGAETTVTYTPSTKFYLQDKQNDTPWVTKLPFPVHCVEKVTVHDKWRNTRFSTTYSYHHGYFDGPEREFRGFGRVEQLDVEDYGTFAAENSNSSYVTEDHSLYQPPVKTVTWYHTGAFLDNTRILNIFKDEYFQPRGTIHENELPEPDLDAQNLTADEWREAMRACKGMMLRQEVFELDAKALAKGEHVKVKLFSTAFHNCHIRLVQLKAINPHAVFHVSESEAITYHYELDLRNQEPKPIPDPRIVHTLNLRIDEYGNNQQSVTAVYPRKGTYASDDILRDNDDALDLIRKVQLEGHMSYTETRYTEDLVSEQDIYRLRLPCEVITYELTDNERFTTFQRETRYFSLKELQSYKISDEYPLIGNDPIEFQDIPYHKLPIGGRKRRLVEHTRTLFFNATLDNPFELGKMNALALPYENYKLALTNDILDLVFGDRITLEVQTGLTTKAKCGYLTGAEMAERFGEGSVAGQYWMCSGVAGFSADARDHFYLPERYTDPFGNTTILNYDPRDLYIRSSIDAKENLTRVDKFDFRVLAPCRMIDLNDNISEVRFDLLGMPAAMVMLGKGEEADNLNGFDDDSLLNLDLVARQNFFVNNDYNVTDAKNLLRGASARHVYYFGEIVQDGKIVWGQHPACACGIVRERHFADAPDSPVQCAFEYSDGMGSVLMKKVQAEPEHPGGPLRWVANGRTILNNKGKPVKQYEPSFCSPEVGHSYELPPLEGVTTIMYYDAPGRLIRTDSPDGSYSRVEFTPWYVKHFDANDTVMEENNKWRAERNLPTASAEDKRAAKLTEEHVDTPSETVLDSLGREVITIAHNRELNSSNELVHKKYVTFTKLDAEGKPLWVQDARGNRVMQYIMPQLPGGTHPFNDPNNLEPQGFSPCYDIAGNLLFQHSMDAGDRWMLNDAAGKPMFAWNNRLFRIKMEYDTLHRPTGSFVKGIDSADPEKEIQFEKLVYGENLVDDKKRNLRGKLFQHFDTAGVVTSEAFDFKGNPLRTIRELTVDYKATPDWSQDPTPALEAESYVARTRYDALNRPIQIIEPHSMMADPLRINITQPTYNEAGLLERVDVWLSQAADPENLLVSDTATQHPVMNINYNAKGQRERLQYGNGSETIYEYDEKTFRLKRLKTTRISDRALLQDLRYNYDPVGNIMQIRDEANDRVFHSNQCVLPGSEYRYDALYRLIAATGREHKGNAGQYDWDDSSRHVPILPNDCQALQNYVETYLYDEVGNIMQMVHHAGRNLEQPGQVIWNRRYQYALDNNRLLTTSLPGDPADLPKYIATDAPGGYSAKYTYDLHGNMTAIPHLPQMRWDFKDHLSATTGTVMNSSPPPDRVPATTYYVYDAAGQRVRKITETQAGALSKQRIYLGGFELYREYSGVSVKLERESLHVMDDKQRVALIETQTIKDQATIADPQPLVRYQHGNHLGSVSLELDENANVITYEEYTPYGSTAYCAGRSTAKVSLKRYRYTGKERDEETGFSYHGARYYAPWVGKWTSCDPIGIGGGWNLYAYSRQQPISLLDPAGTQPTEPEKKYPPNADPLDGGAPLPPPQPDNVNEGGEPVYLMPEEQAKKEQAELPTAGAAPPALASKGVVPTISNTKVRDYIRQEVVTGQKSALRNEPIVILPLFYYALFEHNLGNQERAANALKLLEGPEASSEIAMTSELYTSLELKLAESLLSAGAGATASKFKLKMPSQRGLTMGGRKKSFLENDIDVSYKSNATIIGNDKATLAVGEKSQRWPGTHDVAVHANESGRLAPGTPEGLVETHEAQIAEAISGNPNLQPGQPLRLLTCALCSEQAQTIADLTGRPTFASPLVVGLTKGQLGAGTPQTVNQFIRFDPPLRDYSSTANKQVWNLYLPRGN